MERAEKQARLSERHGATEDERFDRILSPQKRNSSVDRAGMTLPVVEEIGEGGSTAGRSGRSGVSADGLGDNNRTEQQEPRGASGVRLVLPESESFPPTHLSPPLGGHPPPTPPKDFSTAKSMDKVLPEIPSVMDSPIHEDSLLRSFD